MKLKFACILLFVGHFVHCQTFEDIFRDQFCECLTEFYNSIEENEFNCFSKFIISNQAAIETYIDEKENDPDFDNVDFIQEMYLNNQQFFFANCGKYFETINEARITTINNSISGCDTTEIKKLSIHIENYEFDSVFIRERGMCYLALEYYDLAIKDFQTLIEMGLMDSVTQYFLAVSYEQTKSYQKASDIYELLYEETNDDQFKIASEIVKFIDKSE